LGAGGVTAPGAPLTTLVGTAVGATDVCGAATTAVAAGTLINTKLYTHKSDIHLFILFSVNPIQVIT
jgi:hypothetical protein